MRFSEVTGGVEFTVSRPPVLDQREITGVTADSRQVKSGSLYVAIRGTSQDGHDFILPALQSGAAAVLAENPCGASSPDVFIVRDARLSLAKASCNYFKNPSHSLKMVGVTGTSGKTTTAFLVESILKEAGLKVGLLGTVNIRFNGQEKTATHTTPGAPELQSFLSEILSQGCEAVSMEISSHALKLHRTAYTAFDSVIFTNLSPEHLDFHPDMEDYFRSKAILFNEQIQYSVQSGKTPCLAINADDVYGQRLLQEAVSRENLDAIRVRAFSLGGQPKILSSLFGNSSISEASFVDGSDIRTGMAGISGTVVAHDLEGNKCKIDIRSHLIGSFNAQNILGAVSAAIGLRISTTEIERGIQALGSVPGRLERVPNERGLHLLVDYAHKPDALEKVLRVLQSMKGKHRLITVFGCGGDRDRQKRPTMGRIATTLSDLTIVTSDNPRTEDPQTIISEIKKGIMPGASFEVEVDRKKAIYSAVRQAQKGDVVLIAGKGHEDYQIFGTTKAPFDDRLVARAALRSES